MRIVDKARELLIKQDITSFELDIINMDFGKRVIFDTFQNYAEITGMPLKSFAHVKDGCTVIKGSVSVVLTHNLPPPPLHRSGKSGSERIKQAVRRTRWTLAHEVGHIMLNHIKDGYTEEQQANTFATELLMPEPVILELNRRVGGNGLNPQYLSKLFGVSLLAAENRLKQINGKNFFSAYLKREIMEKYKILIKDEIESRVKICQKAITTW